MIPNVLLYHRPIRVLLISFIVAKFSPHVSQRGTTVVMVLFIAASTHLLCTSSSLDVYRLIVVRELEYYVIYRHRDYESLHDKITIMKCGLFHMYRTRMQQTMYILSASY